MKTCTMYIKNAVLQKKEKLSPVQIKHVFQNAIDGVGHRNKIGKVPELGLSGQEIPLRWRMKNDDIIYRVFIKYCVFSLKFCDFSELCQYCWSAGILPA